MKFSLFTLFFLSLGLIIGCQKQQLKKPTKASFTFNSNKNDTQQDIIQIKQVDYQINEFEIIGERKEGASINFVRDLDLAIGFNDQSVISSLNFDIPQGYTHQEISEKLDISVGTSKSQLSRARSLLKIALKKAGF